jgi:hypothetical protein
MDKLVQLISLWRMAGVFGLSYEDNKPLFCNNIGAFISRADQEKWQE